MADTTVVSKAAQAQRMLERISLHVRALRQMAGGGDDLGDVLDVLEETEETLRLIVEAEGGEK
ncbi:hypothetical protein LCGC14_1333060 [marine sediment metagenome]|uniref:Uncharacterized protein n=1 Tax=marine sediment metagenome TaxID=412755 RepID=A0A0F9L1Y7_9ZZZZ